MLQQALRNSQIESEWLRENHI